MKIYIDGHCDTLSETLDNNEKISNTQYCFNTIDAKQLAPVIQMSAVFINPKFENGFERANNIIDYYFKNMENTVIIKNKKDIQYVIEQKKIGIILTIENGKAIESDLNNIDKLYEKGIRLMSINWNEDNLLGTGADTKSSLGLTKLGKEYVKRLEQKNIIIDISHSSEQTFWDTVKNTTGTLVATHSNCYSICNHPRNLTDEQINAIAKRNGIIGICLCSPFLKKEGTANVTDIIRHIKHITNLVGIDYIGLGTDFDGVDEEHRLSDIKGIKDIPILINELRKSGYLEDQIDKIMGENWMRVLSKL